MILWTREALATQTRRSFALLRLIVDEYVVRLVPLGVLVEHALLLQTRRQIECFLVQIEGRTRVTRRGHARWRVQVNTHAHGTVHGYGQVQAVRRATQKTIQIVRSRKRKRRGGRRGRGDLCNAKKTHNKID